MLKTHRKKIIFCVALMMCVMGVTATGCGSVASSSSNVTSANASYDESLLPIEQKGLTPNQLTAIEALDDGYVKSLLNTPCKSVDMEFVDKMDTCIINSDLLASVSYDTMFENSDTVDVAGLLEFGYKPFYLHKDLQSELVEFRWGSDSIKAVGSDYKRFYRINNNYSDASLQVYYSLCEKYMGDGYSLTLEVGSNKIDVTNIEMVKTYIASLGSLAVDEISVYRLDESGNEDLRIKYEIATKTIKTSSWEPDRTNLEEEETPINEYITDVRFTEISLPFVDYSRKSVVPANLPINGTTITYGVDETGKYVGRIDFEFIANEEQAAQLIQFYAKHYSKAKFESNTITIDDGYTVTFFTKDDMYKIDVFCRDNLT